MSKYASSDDTSVSNFIFILCTQELGVKPSWEVIDHIAKHNDLEWQSQVLALLLEREGPNFLTDNGECPWILLNSG